MKVLPIPFSSKWTKGHQDDANKGYLTMDMGMLLNIDIDISTDDHFVQQRDTPQSNSPL